MKKSEAVLKFEKYRMQLEKYGMEESIHAPQMSMLRRKARKQMIEMIKEGVDNVDHVTKLWIAGYYTPYQFFIRKNESEMEVVTLLTMFCGELHELLTFSDKYAAKLNLYIGDLHRYMPKDEIQSTLASTCYTKSIYMDPGEGRAFYALSTVKNSAGFAEKLRLLILAQLAERCYDTSSKIAELLADVEQSQEAESGVSADKFLANFVNWAILQRSSKSDHQKTGIEIVKVFKKEFEKQWNADWPIILSACRHAAQLAIENFEFHRFLDCFDALSDFHLAICAKNSMNYRLLSEALSWIVTAAKAFSALNLTTNEPNSMSLSSFAKDKWNKLNDVIMNQINTVFSSASLSPRTVSFSSEKTLLLLHGPKCEPSLHTLSVLVDDVLSLSHPTMTLNAGEPLLRRINQTIPKRIDVPIETLFQKVNLVDREDWKPVYVIMDEHSLVQHPETAAKILEMNDFICVILSHVFANIDNMKNYRSSIRPLIRTMTNKLDSNYVVRKTFKSEVECAKQLVEKIKEGGSSEDHSQIVALLCEDPEKASPMEGVSFYTIKHFYKKLVA